MNIEEIALRLIEIDCSTDCYFKILDKLEKHTTKIQELEKEKAHIEIAYEEDYKEQQQEIERLNNIINEMEKFFQYAYDNEVRPLNDRKVSVWTICLDKLQELKGSDEE